jgi:hypothetical protein
MQRQNCRSRFLDRAARHVDHWPAVPGSEFAREGDLGVDRGAVDIGEIGAGGIEAQDAVLAKLDDPVRAGDQRDDERVGRSIELGGTGPGTTGILAVLMPLLRDRSRSVFLSWLTPTRTTSAASIFGESHIVVHR